MTRSRSPYDDPMVQAALGDGRAESDIALLPCPHCGTLGYYNEGSHFSCRACDHFYSCIAEWEDPPLDGSPYLVLDCVSTLADWDCGDNFDSP